MITILPRQDVLAGLTRQTLGGFADNLSRRLRQGEMVQSLTAMGLPPELAQLPPDVMKTYIAEHLKQKRSIAGDQYLGEAMAEQPGEIPGLADRLQMVYPGEEVPDFRQPNIPIEPATAPYAVSPRVQDVPYGPEARIEQAMREAAGRKPQEIVGVQEKPTPAMAVEKATQPKAEADRQTLSDRRELDRLESRRAAILGGLSRGLISRQDALQALGQIDTRRDKLSEKLEKREERARKEREERIELDRKHGVEMYKTTADERKTIREEGRKAKTTLDDIRRMEELQQTGKLEDPGYYSFLKNSGLDIPALMSPESQEYVKTVQNFMRNMKEIFGGRVSNIEVEQFMKGIPTLSMSEAGRSRVLASMKRVAKVSVLRHDALKQLVRKYNGNLPLDWQEEVDDMVETQTDKLWREFRADLTRPVPAEKGTPQTTATYGVLGHIVGAPGRLLSIFKK